MTIGLGVTEFEGSSAADLLIALKNGTTKVRKQKEWSAFKILSSWGIRYVESAFVRIRSDSQSRSINKETGKYKNNEKYFSNKR